MKPRAFDTARTPTITIVEPFMPSSRYDLVRQFMALRKATFIDEMDWDLSHADGIEFEQYDSFHAVYVIAHRGKDVIGGARLIRTDRTLGSGRVRYSYMIKDAYDGQLPGLPDDLCYEAPPISEDVWELTRLATLPKIDVARDILKVANRYLADRKAKTCLFLGPPAFMRIARSMGFSPAAIGPIVGNETGRFLAFKCEILKTAEAAI
ncbi:acyl-homoserine-lactone synthase [Jannaschia aquimarina]|uniref:Autoinducer synthetase n=1 Tax=Jannaschia aquimarina TaxID=935700 RepID=A0A0D1D9L3_9RHOB|nr:acyl-homoserine-lactone synthase [Jannaschia aquimarina]KIT16583.1 Autoinducer synthetase [Jannaschia aquimarina]SNT41526.1 acyl homoserine lactone synthase [Jannaschia aquimarina]